MHDKNQMEEQEMKQGIRYSPKTKAEVAIEAIIGADTIADIAEKHKVHPVTVSTWKKELLERAEEVFAKDATNGSSGVCDCTDQTSALYERIGRLTIEMESLKKSS